MESVWFKIGSGRYNVTFVPVVTLISISFPCHTLHCQRLRVLGKGGPRAPGQVNSTEEETNRKR